MLTWWCNMKKRWWGAVGLLYHFDRSLPRLFGQRHGRRFYRIIPKPLSIVQNVCHAYESTFYDRLYGPILQKTWCQTVGVNGRNGDVDSEWNYSVLHCLVPSRFRECSSDVIKSRLDSILASLISLYPSRKLRDFSLS
jgi:hypothetical protein